MKQIDAPAPGVIRRPVAFEQKHHVQAEPVLRRWRLIWLQTLRLAVLAGLLTAWLWIGELVYEDVMRSFGAPARTFHQMLWEFLPWGLWLPLAVWAWYRMLLATRKLWLDNAVASGIQTVEYTPDGVAFWSDAARHFYRWDSFLRVMNRRDVIVLRVNPATAILMPKIDTSEKDVQQLLQWKENFTSPASLLDDDVPPDPTAPPPAITVAAQLDYADSLEAIRLEKRARAKVALVVIRWVRVGLGLLVLLVFLALAVQGFRHGMHGLYWYWSTFGLPLFLLLIYLWAWMFFVLSRRQLWRMVKETTGRPQRIILRENGLELRSRTSLSHYSWSAFNTVEIGKRVVMLGVVGSSPVIIPRRQIPGNEDDFIAFLRRHVMNVTQAFPVEMAAPLQIEN